LFWPAVWKADPGRDHADRADDGGGIGDDLVAGQRDHVAAGSRRILDEDEDALVLLRGEVADALVDQPRLHRRSAGRVDRDGDRRRALDRERLLDRPGHARQRQARPELGAAGKDRAMQADHRNGDGVGAPGGGKQAVEQAFHGGRVSFGCGR
jgi:hypothetical protein